MIATCILLVDKEKFMQHVGVASWFARLCNAQEDFVSRERIVWVDISGCTLYRAWFLFFFSQSDCNKIGAINGRGRRGLTEIKIMQWLLNGFWEVESAVKPVSDTVFGDSIDNNTGRRHLNWTNSILTHSDLLLLRWGTVNIVKTEGTVLLKGSNICEFCSRVVEEAQAIDDNPSPVPNAINNRSKTGGSILDLLDELIKESCLVSIILWFVYKGFGQMVVDTWNRLNLETEQHALLTDFKKNNYSDIDVVLDQGGVNDGIADSRGRELCSIIFRTFRWVKAGTMLKKRLKFMG
ncbi:hypothetical protein Tco_1578465 [Tanacetum coccineum]